MSACTSYSIRCRVCGEDRLKYVGHFKPYEDFETDVFDCEACGCRLIPYDEGIYETLHSTDSSPYGAHSREASEVKHFYDAGNTEGLRNFLSKVSKNRFVIQTIEERSAANILEIGCSRGYLTSFFLSGGYSILGVDISQTAIAHARRLFGDNFVVAEDPRVASSAPYDAIYHVGTVGCVKSPLEMTRSLLSMLKPNGVLVFNAPSLNICKILRTQWIEGAYPPDLVTLFPPEFWSQHFRDLADVSIHAEQMPLDESIAKFIRYRVRKRPVQAAKRSLLSPASERSWVTAVDSIQLAKKIARPVLQGLGTLGLLPLLPASCGSLVVMTRKS